LRLALDALPAKTSVLVDLATAALRSRALVADLGRLGEAGVRITIRGHPADPG
jgi:hypothetical protein